MRKSTVVEFEKPARDEAELHAPVRDARGRLNGKRYVYARADGIHMNVTL